MEAVLLLPLVLVILWLWGLISAVSTPDDRFRVGNTLLWVIIVAAAGPVGAIAYLLAGHPSTGGLMISSAAPRKTGRPAAQSHSTAKAVRASKSLSS